MSEFLGIPVAWPMTAWRVKCYEDDAVHFAKIVLYERLLAIGNYIPVQVDNCSYSMSKNLLAQRPKGAELDMIIKFAQTLPQGLIKERKNENISR